MPWIKKLPLPCTCPLPGSREAGVGSVWQCDRCEQKWKVGPWYWQRMDHDDN